MPSITRSRRPFSNAQREYILGEATARIEHLRAVTSDMNVFDPQSQFDRVVSVEMFEHIVNWRQLLSRVKSWLKPDGRDEWRAHQEPMMKHDMTEDSYVEQCSVEDGVPAIPSKTKTNAAPSTAPK